MSVLFVVAPLLLRMLVSVLANENFSSKSSLSTSVAPRLNTKALLLMVMEVDNLEVERAALVDTLSFK